MTMMMEDRMKSPGVHELAKRFSSGSAPQSPLEFQEYSSKQNANVVGKDQRATVRGSGGDDRWSMHVRNLRDAMEQEKEVVKEEKKRQNSFKGIGTLTKMDKEMTELKKKHDEFDKAEKLKASEASAKHTGPGWNDFRRLSQKQMKAAEVEEKVSVHKVAEEGCSEMKDTKENDLMKKRQRWLMCVGFAVLCLLVFRKRSVLAALYRKIIVKP